MAKDFKIGACAIWLLFASSVASGKRLKLAARAKRYLVRERGFEPERLLIVDAGFNESSVTRLGSYSVGGAGTRIYLFPQKDPEATPPGSRAKTRFNFR